MTVFYHQQPSNPSINKCKFLTACLKDAFSNCHSFGGRLSTSNPDEDYPSDFDDEQEVVVSAIRSGAMEKLRKKPIVLSSDSFSWVYYSPIAREFYITPKGVEQKEDGDDEDYEREEEFLSVKSCFTCCSSGASRDVFLSVKTSFSSCSSLNGYGIDLKEFQRRSLIQEICHCEGWPFGLCRKAVLLPPLPKSPSESWSWRKGTKMVKLT